jgi:hypothetical protein
MAVLLLPSGRMLALLMLLMPALSEPGGEEANWRFDRSRWQGSIAVGGTVAIRNHHGNVYLRVVPGDQVEVLAAIQHEAGDPEPPEARVEAVEGGVEVVVRLNAKKGGTAPYERVDLTVFVPPDSPLEVQTTAGDIEAKGFAAAGEYESETGDILVFSSGAIRAKTDRGAIVARLDGDDWQGARSFETVTGDIEVRLPSTASAAVELRTTGLISTDFSIEIDRPEGSRRKHGRALIGDPLRSPVTLSTENGDLRLLQSD